MSDNSDLIRKANLKIANTPPEKYIFPPYRSECLLCGHSSGFHRQAGCFAHKWIDPYSGPCGCEKFVQKGGQGDTNG